MKLLYDAGIRLYGLGARVAAIRSDKARKFCQGRSTALIELEKLTAERAPDGYHYWFHAASLGEFEQARPLIERIATVQPDAKILLTFFSPSGYDVRKDYPHATTVAYLPADTKANARKFLDIARPRKAIFVKYEFWLNFLDTLGERKIPTFLISAIFRPNQIFFRPWGSLFRRCLQVYTLIFVQDEASRELLAGIGINRVKIAGDTRFDRVEQIRKTITAFPAIDGWLADKPFTIVVGSSWEPDEDRYLPWLNAHPEVRAIIAPHQFDEARLKTLQKRIGARSILWSQIPFSGIPEDTQVLIVDTFGKLSSLYRYADLAIVGGGFGAGIHNINEAAVYGIPVAIGPRHEKFREARDLVRLGGAFVYRDEAEISALLTTMASNPERRLKSAAISRQYVETNLGATDIILAEI